MTLTAATVTPAATKIMLIRHAEKPQSNPPLQGVDINGEPDNESLIVLGWQRAGALVVYFAPSVGLFQNSEIATPQFIYASNVTSGSDSKRPQETVTPLIDKLGSGNVTVNFNFAKGKKQEKHVAESAMACNGVVLICWEHQDIPNITKHFPISPNNPNPVPKKWPTGPNAPDGRYDVVWVFDLDSQSGGYCFYPEPQLLLAGDTGY
jgi:hypothetical protein